MYIDVVPNRKSRPAILLRASRRVGSRTVKATLANLTDWPPDVVAGLRRLLERRWRGEPIGEEAFAIERSIPHGHVQAALAMAKKIGLDALIASKPSRQRDLVLAMAIERLIDPGSKLATTRLWHTTTLARELGVEEATVDDLYAAMDWLSARQERIERKLAQRHLSEGALVLYDVTSSYYEGRHCPLARFGHSRDGKKGRPIIVYGLLSDGEGRPVAVETYPGDTGDPTTVPDAVERLRRDFGLERVVLVGDRGMLTQTQIDRLKEYPQLGWISALRSGAIRALARQGAVQMTLFDKQNLAEIASPDFPGERLVVCYNPQLGEERARKRRELIEATRRDLDKIAAEARRRTKTPLSNEQIALKVGRVIHRRKMAKHFVLRIDAHRLDYEINEAAVAEEQALDGIYVIRTSESAEHLSAPQAVRAYKSLAQVERAFRTMKTVELEVRPIFHRTERRVPTHIFLCMLAYYLEWHLRKAWKPLLFDDEDLDEDRRTRDPVAPARPSDGARRKKAARQTEDGLPVHSFRSLLAELGTLCKNRCRIQTGKTETRIDLATEPTDLQARAFHLIEVCPVHGI
jgi:hypothetical protein